MVTYEVYKVVEVGVIYAEYKVGSKVITYVGEDAVALLTNAALETEGQVVTADHDTAAEALLKRLHVWLDAREVQPLDIGWEGGRGGKRGRKEGGGIKAGDKTTGGERLIQSRGDVCRERRKRTKEKETA